MSQINTLTSIDPQTLRPSVAACDRLEKWLPPFTIRNSLPVELVLKQKQLALNAFAKSTRATYGTGLAKYHLFCDTIGLPEINRVPCTTNLMSGFIAYLSGFYSKTAIINFLASVKAWHHVNLIPYDLDEKLLSVLLRGAGRVQPLPQPRRQPLTINQLKLILMNLDPNIPEQVAVAACLSTTFFCCARLGEFTVPTVKSFSPKNHITINDVTFEQDRNFNKVTAFHLPRTKTSATGETVFWAPQETGIDPQKLLYQHLQINEPLPHEHLFSFKTEDKKLPMSRNTFLRNVHRAASLANVNFQSGHSIRIGATLEYLLRGIPFEVVKQIGRWSSNSFTLYLRQHGRILAPYIQQNPSINAEFIEYTNIALR